LEQGEEKISPSKSILKRIITDPKYIFLLFTFIIVIIILVYRSPAAGQMVTYQRVMMDTAVELRFETAPGSAADAIAESVFTEIERLEKLFSRSLPESDVSRVNFQAGVSSVPVSSDVLHVTEKALHYGEISGGAFDPTIAPLIDLWGFFGQDYRLPAKDEIEAVLPLVDYRLLAVDRNNSELFLPDRDMALELGGIAKGYIVGRSLEILKESGISSAFVNAGGDIGLIGLRPDGTSWRIGIRHPRDANKVIAVIPAEGGAVVTSGDYERTFEVSGVNYHHILDPQNGMPAVLLTSVTIVADTAIAADALSTTIFVLGPDQGLALIEQLSGVEGVLITPDLEIIVSSGLVDIIELHP